MTRTRPARVLALLAALPTAVLLALPATPALAGPVPVPAAARAAVPGLDPGLPTSGPAVPVVVTGPGSAAALRLAVLRAGGTVARALPLVGGLSARVPAARLRALATAPGVGAVTADRVGHVTGSSYDDSVSASAYAWSSRAAQSWSRSRGAGVAVAVLDTGVSPVGDLQGRLVSGPDLSGEGAPARDSYGHGTVMAGIVAGSGADAGAAPRTGVAPDAKVVSVKVAGANGAADVSTVLAAMHWVAAFRDTYGIRVLNLSWGVPSTQDPRVDPLDHAVERLWSLGITVVVAAGNSGPTAGSVLKPADDPLVLTVGAYDDKGDLNLNNDAVPSWSSRGPTAQGLAKPDLVAPGRTLVATRAPGSTVEKENPKALVAPSYVRGSGTSEATAVVSGLAAQLLSARPSLTPDQVKAALVRTAVPLQGVDPIAQGAGRVAGAEALVVPTPASATQTVRATGTGTLERSRGSAPRVQVRCDGTNRVLDDETTAWCGRWDATSWTSAPWTATSWTSTGWDGATWSGDAWAATSWTATSWTATSWTATSWTATSWTATSWTATSWTATSWTSGLYEGADTSFLSAWWGARPGWWQRVPGEPSDAEPAVCGRRHACLD